MSGIFHFKNFLKILIGCTAFALGFDLFLLPNGLNAGGISGLSMVLVTILKFGTIGVFTGILNFPLFAVSGIKFGKKFFRFLGGVVGIFRHRPVGHRYVIPKITGTGQPELAIFIFHPVFGFAVAAVRCQHPPF